VCLHFPLFFDGRGSACWCMCVYVRTHTHTARGVLGCEPRGRDETPGGPEESRWTTSRHVCIRICVQSTHVYTYAGRRHETFGSLVFLFNIFFFPKKKSNRCQCETENSNPYGFELHRPSIKGTKLLFKVVKAIIIIMGRVLPFFLHWQQLTVRQELQVEAIEGPIMKPVLF